MSKYDRDIQDVYAVKQLGDSIGYGHLMAIAHELWARHLESKGLPRTGAHCAVGYPMVKDEHQAEAINDKIYSIIVSKALTADRKTESDSEIPNNCERIVEYAKEMFDTMSCEECGHWEHGAGDHYYCALLETRQECCFESKDESTFMFANKPKTEPQFDKDINVRSKDEPQTERSNE